MKNTIDSKSFDKQGKKKLSPKSRKYMDRKTGDRMKSPKISEGPEAPEVDAPGMKGGGYCRGAGAAIKGTKFEGVF
jgi:hypothetical protein